MTEKEEWTLADMVALRIGEAFLSPDQQAELRQLQNALRAYADAIGVLIKGTKGTKK